jgi:SAM-dependent MidA family methyltransferase
MNALEQKICERIKLEGPITFETFMKMALYEPGLGYYASENTDIGKAGDFFTSQHLHPIFGAMIGRQLEEMWEILGKPSFFHIVEFGAGTGLLCLDIMNYLRDKALFDTLTYVIVEINPFLRDKQEKLLHIYSGKLKWASSSQELSAIEGCILSNELLDAFPVHLVEMEDELKEIYVAVADGHFKEIKGPLSTDFLAAYLKEFAIELPAGYRAEINLRIKDWLASSSKLLSKGFILTIDYGYPAQEYYSEDRNRGTLLCYYRHQVNENPYQNAGVQDITAHVNFSSLKKWGEEFGLKTLGFCNQGAFFVSLGIDRIMSELFTNSSDYLFEIAKIKRLILPGTIGETHKVMIQYKGTDNPNLRGFAIKNQKDRL